MTLLDVICPAYLEVDNKRIWVHKTPEKFYFDVGDNKYISEDELSLEQQELIFLSDEWKSAVDEVMEIALYYMSGANGNPPKRIHTLRESNIWR